MPSINRETGRLDRTPDEQRRDEDEADERAYWGEQEFGVARQSYRIAREARGWSPPIDLPPWDGTRNSELARHPLTALQQRNEKTNVL